MDVRLLTLIIGIGAAVLTFFIANLIRKDDFDMPSYMIGWGGGIISLLLLIAINQMH